MLNCKVVQYQRMFIKAGGLRIDYCGFGQYFAVLPLNYVSLFHY